MLAAAFSVFVLWGVVLLCSYIMLSHSDIVLPTVFRANKISLRREVVISLGFLFCRNKGFGYYPKVFVLTNAMLVFLVFMRSRR